MRIPHFLWWCVMNDIRVLFEILHFHHSISSNKIPSIKSINSQINWINIHFQTVSLTVTLQCTVERWCAKLCLNWEGAMVSHCSSLSSDHIPLPLVFIILVVITVSVGFYVLIRQSWCDNRWCFISPGPHSTNAMSCVCLIWLEIWFNRYMLHYCNSTPISHLQEKMKLWWNVI